MNKIFLFSIRRGEKKLLKISQYPENFQNQNTKGHVYI